MIYFINHKSIKILCKQFQDIISGNNSHKISSYKGNIIYPSEVYYYASVSTDFGSIRLGEIINHTVSNVFNLFNSGNKREIT